VTCINPGFLRQLLKLEDGAGKSSLESLFQSQELSCKVFFEKFCLAVDRRENPTHEWNGGYFRVPQVIRPCVEELFSDQARDLKEEPSNINKSNNNNNNNNNHGKQKKTLAVLDFLRSQGGKGKVAAEEMAKRFGLKMNRSEEFRELFQFVYSSTNSNLADPLVSECRGIILEYQSAAARWAVVALPFYKFFNFGDDRAGNDFDWSNFSVTEKLDGMFVFAYSYRNSWHVATQSVCDGRNTVQGGETVSQIFFRILEAQGWVLPCAEGNSLVLMFELLSPRVQVVVQQEEEKLVLIGARDMETLQEQEIVTVAKELGFVSCPRFFYSKEEALAKVAGLNGIISEGFVFTDSRFNRLKLKAPSYVSLGHLKGLPASSKLSAKHLITILLNGDDDEVKLAFPNLKDKLERYYSALKELEEEVTAGKGESVGIKVPLAEGQDVVQYFRDVSVFDDVVSILSKRVGGDEEPEMDDLSATKAEKQKEKAARKQAKKDLKKQKQKK
jgi:hypothetical protein